jgi:hypothetical protein
MANCFVMQPFDRGTFDKRYEDIFDPAIRAAGFEPYRVDRDPSVSIPIEEIEAGIRSSQLCLAEITTDNPNVWFELGYAICSKKAVCLVCSKERQTKFPFDVQHRSIIHYDVASTSDFDRLKASITGRLKALFEKQEGLEAVAAAPLRETKGLHPHEIVVLSIVMKGGFLTSEGPSGYNIKQDMEIAGYNETATGLGLISLRRKGYIVSKDVTDRDGDTYTVYNITQAGTDWLLANQDKLTLRAQGIASAAGDEGDISF